MTVFSCKLSTDLFSCDPVVIFGRHNDVPMTSRFLADFGNKTFFNATHFVVDTMGKRVDKRASIQQEQYNMIDYIDIADRRWTIRRTCIDTPGRAYAARLVDEYDANVLPKLGIGFYAETIADIHHQLNGGN